MRNPTGIHGQSNFFFESKFEKQEFEISVNHALALTMLYHILGCRPLADGLDVSAV